MKTKKQRLTLLFSLIAFTGFAQVGVGTTTPAGSLDVTSVNDGLLVPRIALINTTTATVLTPTTSEIIYNTATINDVTPGFYYWEGAPTNKWIRISTGTGNNWSLTGNALTTAGTNFIGTTDAVDFVGKTNGTERFRVLSTGNTGFGTTTPASSLSIAANSTIGATYASANAAPANGLRVEGQTVIGKASGEDSRDIFSANTSATAYQNIVGYPNNTKKRAISGYSDDSGIGVFGYATRTGYGVVGLTQPGTISNFVQTGEGVLGQADGSSGATSIPIGVHGIIDEAASGELKSVPVLGENNNITKGSGLAGGAYNSSGPAASAVYGNFATRSSSSNAFQFGVIGDILLLGVATQPNATGGVLGTNAASSFGILGYKTKAGTNYSIYGGINNGSIGAANGGRYANQTPNNYVGLGINGGFMGGYVKGNQYGLISSGKEFGMYVQGNTIVNEPIVQLTDKGNSRIATYTTSSTSVDVSTRGKGKLTNGESFIAFDKNFTEIANTDEESINITVTPTGATKGVYVSRVTPNGFYIKENMEGTSNASFNWTAISIKKGYENGVEISKTILGKDFDEKMNSAMNNDGGKEDGTPIYFDGKEIKFEKIPENYIQYQKKSVQKK